MVLNADISGITFIDLAIQYLYVSIIFRLLILGGLRRLKLAFLFPNLIMHHYVVVVGYIAVRIHTVIGRTIHTTVDVSQSICHKGRVKDLSTAIRLALHHLHHLHHLDASQYQAQPVYLCPVVDMFLVEKALYFNDLRV